MATTILAVTAAILAFLSAYGATWAIIRSIQTQKWVEANNKRALSLAKMAEVEAELTDLKDSYVSLLESHKTLRSRIGMRLHREAKKAAQADAETPKFATPDEEREALEIELQAAGKLNPRIHINGGS